MSQNDRLSIYWFLSRLMFFYRSICSLSDRLVGIFIQLVIYVTYTQEGHSINKVHSNLYIFPEKFAIRSIVYSCPFFKKINSEGSFYVSEHCQCDFFTDRYARINFFFFTGEYISIPWSVFSTRLIVANPCSVHLSTF